MIHGVQHAIRAMRLPGGETRGLAVPKEFT
jgi:hypothetical protein